MIRHIKLYRGGVYFVLYDHGEGWEQYITYMSAARLLAYPLFAGIAVAVLGVFLLCGRG